MLNSNSTRGWATGLLSSIAVGCGAYKQSVVPTPAEPSVVIEGIVRDAVSGTPLVGAVVTIGRDREIVDGDGRFSIVTRRSSVAQGTVLRTGYDRNSFQIRVRDVDSVVTRNVTLEPKRPVLLTLRRGWHLLREHVNHFFYQFTTSDIVRTDSPDLLTFLLNYTFFRPAPCNFDSFHTTCVNLDGERKRVWIRVDDRFTDRLTDLRSTNVEDVVLLTATQSGEWVHAYTREYLEQVALTPQVLRRVRWVRAR